MNMKMGQSLGLAESVTEFKRVVGKGTEGVRFSGGVVCEDEEFGRASSSLETSDLSSRKPAKVRRENNFNYVFSLHKRRDIYQTSNVVIAETVVAFIFLAILWVFFNKHFIFTII